MQLQQLLVRGHTEREWIAHMHRRALAPQAGAGLLLLITVGASAIWNGAITVLPVALSAPFFVIGDAVARRSKKFGLLAAVSILGVVAYTATAALSGAGSGSLALLIFPPIVAMVAFPGYFGPVITALCVAGMVVAGLGFDYSAIAADPSRLVMPIAVVIAVALMASSARGSSIEHHSARSIDQLTGMLNRAALATRCAELEEQSALIHQPVGVIVCDLDHFKEINDSRGHAVGDRVLSGFAYRLRSHLRSFDLAYRLGGEEFVILLPGAGVVEGLDLAERLAQAVRSEPIDGARVTASFGVAASDPGGTFVFDEVFAAADEALYEAKRAGRDRTRGAGVRPVEAPSLAVAR